MGERKPNSQPVAVNTVCLYWCYTYSWGCIMTS